MRDNLIRISMSKVFKNNKRTVLLLLFTIISLILVSLIPPQILRIIIDEHLIPKKNGGLLMLGILYMSILLLNGAFESIKEVLLTVLGQKITTKIRKEMTSKLGRVSSRYFSREETGVIVSRMTNDVDSVSSMFTSGIISMFIDSFKVIGIIISIGYFSRALGLVTLIILPIVFIVVRIFQDRMLKAQMHNRVLTGKINNHISESLKNMKLVKSYNVEAFMEKRYRNFLLQNFKTIEKSNFYDSIFSPIIQIMRTVVIALIVILSVPEVNFLGISVGMVAAAIELFTNLFSPIENIGMELQEIQQAFSGIRRVNEFYEEPEEEVKSLALKAEDIIKDREAVKISFHDVSFRYEDNQEILKGINLEIKPMEKVALTGRTGAGKSTIFKLLMGFLTPVEGAITINGFDVTRIPNKVKRRIIGYVEQDFHFIKGSLREQITLNDEMITEDDVKRSINLTGFNAYVDELPEGLDTILTDRTVFSSGQIQLLSISRALAANPPILLLDEITANLDSLTEEKILSILEKASEKHTILSVSHRLSTMLSSDRIIILENGKIRNEGTPQRLLREDDWIKSKMILENLTWD